MDIIQPVRGTSDLLPADKAKHNHVIDCAKQGAAKFGYAEICLLYTSPSPRDLSTSRMPSSA